MSSTKKESINKKPSKVFRKDLGVKSTRSKQLAESKRRQIVDGACKILFKKGYHQTTIREIAESCEMSMGQLYHYISSKDDVLFLVHKRMQELWHEHLKNSTMIEIQDPAQKLTDAFQRTLEFMEENRKLLRFIFTESKHMDKGHLRVVLEMDYKNVIGFWRQQLAALSKYTPLEGDLDFLASLVSYILVFLPLRGWTVRDKPITVSIDSLKNFLLRGLGVAGSSVSR